MDYEVKESRLWKHFSNVFNSESSIRVNEIVVTSDKKNPVESI